MLHAVGLVDGGVLQEYNAAASPNRRVCAGDFIIEVNDLVFDSSKMLKAMAEERKLRSKVAPAVAFAIVVDRKGSLGLTTVQDSTSQSLSVMRVDDGPLKEWNKMAPTERMLCPLDRVVEVNGLRGRA